MQEIAEWIKKGFTSGKGNNFSWELKIEDLEEEETEQLGSFLCHQQRA